MLNIKFYIFVTYNLYLSNSLLLEIISILGIQSEEKEEF